MKASRTFAVRPIDIRAIRQKLGRSQSEFAHMIGVSVSTLQNWEQGRRRPEGPARALLKIASENPEIVSAGTGDIARKLTFRDESPVITVCPGCSRVTPLQVSVHVVRMP